MIMLRKILFGAASPALLLGLLVAFSSAQAAEHKKRVKHAPKQEVEEAVIPANAIPQETAALPCAKESQDCDTRTRADRSRADTRARDHHSEGHHDHGAEGQH